MKQLKVLSAVGLFALAASTANAGISSTVTATNDYDFRGVTQSGKDPAIQASLDYAHDSGFYAGAWASTIDFGPTSNAAFELDLYAGFTNKIGEDLTYDVGAIGYNYPDAADLNTVEFYGSLAWKIIKGKVSYTNDYYGTGLEALYLDASVNVPIGERFSAQAHIGQSSGDAFPESVMDYSAGVGLTLGNFAFVLKYVDTDASVSKGNLVTGDIFNNEGRVIFTVATTFPWK
jgi:uncharacterized protein (TIGR02001 family)